MAIISYRDNRFNRPRVVAPGIARTQATGPVQGPALNPVTGRADYAQNVATIPRQNLNAVVVDPNADANQVEFDFSQGGFPSVIAPPPSGSSSSITKDAFLCFGSGFGFGACSVFLYAETFQNQGWS